MFRAKIESLPEGAVQCSGPLMYDLNRYITRDGRMFNVHATTGTITQIKIGKLCTWAWSSAKQLLADGSITNMPSINGFYSKTGTSTPHAIMAYYFVEKINPIGMRALISYDFSEEDMELNDLDRYAKSLHADNIFWVSKYEQRRRSITISHNVEGGKKKFIVKKKIYTASTFIKVDPNTMTMVEEIKNLIKYASDHNLVLKTLRRVVKSGDLYADYYWLDTSLEGSLYTQDSTGIIFIRNINMVLRHAQDVINQAYINNILTESMVPIENGNPVRTIELNNLLNELDLRGLGNESAIAIVNDRICGHLPCCYVISIHGGCSNKQLVICLKTMIVFARSRDNLGISKRTCPMCVASTCDNTIFHSDAPEMGLPVFTYYPAAGSRANKNPLGFIKMYITCNNALENCSKLNLADNLPNMRKSLFGLTNKWSNYWIKYSNGFPKRMTYNNVYWSFHQPVNGKLNESVADWLLTRRLNCAIMQRLRATTLSFQPNIDD